MARKIPSRVVSLSKRSVAELSLIQEIWGRKKAVPELNKSDTVASALSLFREVIDPDSDLVAVDRAALDELTRGKSFLIVCQAISAILEHCELFPEGFVVRGDPKTETIEIEVGSKKIVLVPPLQETGVEATHAFSGRAAIH